MQRYPDTILRSNDREAGFAVVIALSLMSFVLLLILGLTTLVRVESANAASAKERLVAKETAHLALIMALGDLQRYAGPDARVTTTAAVLDNDTADSATFGGIAEGAAAWTGVWDTNNVPRHYYNIDGSNPSDWGDVGEKTSTALKWLVSGGDVVAPDLAVAESVALGSFQFESFPTSPIGGVLTTVAVEVPKVALEPSAASGIRSYAYWVQDIGVSSSIRRKQIDTALTASASNGNRVLDTLAEKQLPRGLPVEILSPSLDPLLDDSVEQERLLTQAQFESKGSFAESPLDFFPSTSAVLSNPVTGELRKNLTDLIAGKSVPWDPNTPMWTDADVNPDLTPKPHSGPNYASLADWVSEPDSSGKHTVRAPEVSANGAIRKPSLHPVITRVQFFAQVTPYGVPANAPTPPDTQIPPKMRVHIYPMVSIWNPHDVPIVATEYGLELDCRVDFLVAEIYLNGAGFPTLRGFPGPRDEIVDYYPGTGQSDDRIFPQNIINFHGSPTMLGGSPMIFRLREVELQPGECLIFSPESYQNLDLEAIRLRNWSMANVLTSSPPFRQINSFQVDSGIEMQTNGTGDQWHLMSASTPGVAKIYHRYATIGTDHDEITASLFDLSASPPSLLQEVSDLVWVEHKELPPSSPDSDKFLPAWNTAFYEINGPEPNLSPGKGHIFYSKPSVVKFQSPDEESAHGGIIAPFSSANPWAVRSSESPGDADDRNQSWGGVISNASQNWFVPDSDTTDPNRLRGFTGAIYRLVDLPALSSGPGNHYLSLFQPENAGEVISLATLQHFPLSSKSYFPAHAIGRPAAEEGGFVDLANRAIWDDFYLTGGELTGGRSFANDRLELASGAGISTASDIMQVGALNVNSPYPRAWLATIATQLNMLVDHVSAVDMTGVLDSLTLDSLSSPFLHALRPASGPESSAQAANPSAWRGYRQLTENGGKNQLSLLADAIASGVRSRGPFASMADFVNSGVLQEAIDSTGINVNFGAELRESPGYLSQADLLQSLAPALNYRSDTFRIRTYGETRDLNNRLAASVVCEAIVQRLPEPDTFSGRRFKVVSYEFLSPTDL